MLGRCIADESMDTAGYSCTLSLISGKYKTVIPDLLCEWGDRNRA